MIIIMRVRNFTVMIIHCLIGQKAYDVFVVFSLSFFSLLFYFILSLQFNQAYSVVIKSITVDYYVRN